MVPNIKYYVVTIASIFLALGVGIFLGFILDVEGYVSSQKEDIVVDLQETFDEMKVENERVSEEMAKVSGKNTELNNYIEQTLPIVVDGELSGNNIAIIETSEDYLYEGVQELLAISDADVVSNTIIMDSVYENVDAIESIYTETVGENTELEFSQMIASEIKKSIENYGITPFVDRLIEEGYITVDGNHGARVDTILLAGGSNDEDEESENISRSLVSELKDGSIRTVGIERTDVDNSYIDHYRDNRISSVDNVDTAIGKASLVAVIKGKNGNFGESESSVEYRPNLDILIEQ